MTGMSLEHDVISVAREHGIHLTMAPRTRWLTERGHLDPVVGRRAPASVLDALDALHEALGGDRRALQRAAATPLRHGLRVATTGQLVEIDDLAHLTGDRLASLSYYPDGVPVGFCTVQYRALIETWRDRASHVFTKRWNADFDFAGGRRARRAYEDALRDLLAPVFTGLPTLRLAAPDGDAHAAVDQLRPAVAA
jgi:hypothetical protein